MSKEYLLFKLFFLLFITRKSHNFNLGISVKHLLCEYNFSISINKKIYGEANCNHEVLTLKNSLSGVSLWACGLGTESHIYNQEKARKSTKTRIFITNKISTCFTFWISSLKTGSKFSRGVYTQTKNKHIQTPTTYKSFSKESRDTSMLPIQ